MLDQVLSKLEHKESRLQQMELSLRHHQTFEERIDTLKKDLFEVTCKVEEQKETTLFVERS